MMKFENVYWDEGSLISDGKNASILAIGDSWFFYPLLGGSLLNPLGKIVKSKDHVIFALGSNGAEAFDYVEGKFSKQTNTALRRHGGGLSAVFISGGGNDVAGFNDLRPLLKQDCSNAKNESECFKEGYDYKSVGWLMQKMNHHYTTLMSRIITNTPPFTKIIIHTYDYARPNGKGVFGSRSNWLKPALDAAKVPTVLHQKCMNLLIDSFKFELDKVANVFPARVALVDTRGTLSDSDWANELHPNKSGFKKLANKWRPLLENNNLSAKKN